MKITIEFDSGLVDDASKVYQKYGFDVKTALEMFLTRSKLEQKLPIDETQIKDFTSRCRAIYEFHRMREEIVSRPEYREWSMSEIDAIIADTRAKRKERLLQNV